MGSSNVIAAASQVEEVLRAVSVWARNSQLQSVAENVVNPKVFASLVRHNSSDKMWVVSGWIKSRSEEYARGWGMENLNKFNKSVLLQVSFQHSTHYNVLAVCTYLDMSINHSPFLQCPSLLFHIGWQQDVVMVMHIQAWAQCATTKQSSKFNDLHFV